MPRGWGLSGDRVETMATSTGSTGVYWVAGVLGLLGAAGGLAYVLLQGEAGEDATVPVMPESVILEDLTGGGEPAETGDAAPEPIVPDFSNFRLQNGLALMAGTAEPGAMLDILLDGESIAQAEVSSAGQYTAIFDIPPSAMPRILSFATQLGDADPVHGARTIIVQPFGMPDPEPQAPEQVGQVDATDTQGDLDGDDATAAETPREEVDAIALSDRAPDVIGDVEVPEVAPAAPVIALSDRAPDVVGDVEVPSDIVPESVVDAEVPLETTPPVAETALSDRAPDVIGDAEVPEVAPAAPEIALSDRAPDVIGDAEVPEVAPSAPEAERPGAGCDRGRRGAGGGSGVA